MNDDLSDWQRFEAYRDRATGRLNEFVHAALKERREPRGDWREAVEDAVNVLARLRASAHHPDDRDKAAEALSCLAGIWLDSDEIDDAYLGEEKPPSPPGDPWPLG
jgi:hypothetical protein